MRIQDRVQKLEKEIGALWRVIDDERLWHPSIVKEIRNRSLHARREFARGKLRKAGVS